MWQSYPLQPPKLTGRILLALATGAVMMIVSTPGNFVEARSCIKVLSNERGSERCQQQKFPYQTEVANQCDAAVDIYLQSASGHSTRQELAAESKRRFFDCGQPVSVVGWCYPSERAKCENPERRRSIEDTQQIGQKTALYGQILGTLRKLETLGIGQKNLNVWAARASSALESFQHETSLLLLLNIDAELRKISEDVIGWQLDGLKTSATQRHSDPANVHRPVRFLGRWGITTDTRPCKTITEIVAVGIAADQRINVRISNEDNGALESTYHWQTLTADTISLGRGGTLTRKGDRLIWKHQDEISRQYRPCD